MREAAKKAAATLLHRWLEGPAITLDGLAEIIDSAITETNQDAVRLAEAVLEYIASRGIRDDIEGNDTLEYRLLRLGRKVKGGE